MTTYVVIRPAPELPADYIPDRLNGRWLDLDDKDQWLPDHTLTHSLILAAALPTGRYETRDDGAQAEVWEVQPGIPDQSDTEPTPCD